ncbi:MAG TPA: cupin domain-containing protein [Gaiellaceae bacterium]|nr:cupin domain-containing protein [Gaiellaceae bacterium]
MSLHRELEFRPVADPDDPDDWRPGSELAVVFDAAANMAVLGERLAPGDTIPLHRHRTDEAVVYLAGTVEVRLGGEKYEAQPGDVLLIPAGTPHSMRNTGDVVAEFRATFPSARVDIEYLERNPMPGTEGDQPQPPFAVDLHTGAVSPLDAG